MSEGVHATIDGCVTLSLKRWLPPESGTVVLVDIDAHPTAHPIVNFPSVLRCTHTLSREQCHDQSVSRADG